MLLFRIQEHELIGEGAFGEVYKATLMKLTVAVKKLKGGYFTASVKNNTCKGKYRQFRMEFLKRIA